MNDNPDALLETTNPMWPISVSMGLVPVNRIRSPRFASASGTVVPTLKKSIEERGTLMLKWVNTYVINPEQSKPTAGSLDAHTYGIPISVSAKRTSSSGLVLPVWMGMTESDDSFLNCATFVCNAVSAAGSFSIATAFLKSVSVTGACVAGDISQEKQHPYAQNKRRYRVFFFILSKKDKKLCHLAYLDDETTVSVEKTCHQQLPFAGYRLGSG